MATPTDRIRHLLADQLDDCCESDVDERLSELDTLADDAFSDDPARPVFAVLGNETRYRLARALTVADGELCVCELESLVDVSESAVSHALADLVDAALVTRRKSGNWRYYTATTLAEDLFATADDQVASA